MTSIELVQGVGNIGGGHVFPVYGVLFMIIATSILQCVSNTVESRIHIWRVTRKVGRATAADLLKSLIRF
jgi:hypothetical protein